MEHENVYVSFSLKLTFGFRFPFLRNQFLDYIMQVVKTCKCHSSRPKPTGSVIDFQPDNQAEQKRPVAICPITHTQAHIMIHTGIYCRHTHTLSHTSLSL